MLGGIPDSRSNQGLLWVTGYETSMSHMQAGPPPARAATGRLGAADARDGGRGAASVRLNASTARAPAAAWNVGRMRRGGGWR
jgi:hypothetical protein